ncbi:hypothetical protein MGWOODY_Smn3339 [hydrothermal vent metagenome]|uniref:Uncharacterized protein n=1 Tax=hydrothermal vent metagenome TaxID=652676 RepID=A0A160TJY7_9ZZZZ
MSTGAFRSEKAMSAANMVERPFFRDQPPLPRPVKIAS